MGGHQGVAIPSRLTTTSGAPGWVGALAMRAHSSPMNVPTAIRASQDDRYRLVAREVEAQLGSDVAATYMTTRNFSLGGLTPTELVATEKGSLQVLAEISAQANGGPL